MCLFQVLRTMPQCVLCGMCNCAFSIVRLFGSSYRVCSGLSTCSCVLLTLVRSVPHYHQMPVSLSHFSLTHSLLIRSLTHSLTHTNAHSLSLSLQGCVYKASMLLCGDGVLPSRKPLRLHPLRERDPPSPGGLLGQADSRRNALPPLQKDHPSRP